MGVYVSTAAEQSVFVYGKFRLPAGVSLPGGNPAEESVAIEVLREFSAYEFIGKVFVRREPEWRPLTPEAASARDWYIRFQGGAPVFIEIQGSGRWEIAWFRFESSIRNPNPYVAVALRQVAVETAQRPSAIPGT
jgi:hypothetical protein